MPAKSRRPSRNLPVLTVLAGVNGAGKSSVGGTALRATGAAYFNPDEYARKIRERLGLAQERANAVAWAYGKEKLENAIQRGVDFTFESTLGGKTIADLLLQAAGRGHALDLWFVGLGCVELHLQRIARRVAQGGHPIPEADVRKRWIGSRENLIRLIPFVRTLRVFDNSREVAAPGEAEPELLLSIEAGELVYPGPENLPATPEWAKPIVAAAYRHFGLID